MSDEEKKTLTEEDLTFAASDTCPCGAKLAYKPDDDCWDCSDILLGKAIEKDEKGSVKHTARLPFRLWKVKVKVARTKNAEEDKKE